MCEVGGGGAGGGAEEEGALGESFCGEEDGGDVGVEGEGLTPAVGALAVLLALHSNMIS